MKRNQAQEESQPIIPRYLTVEQAAHYTGFTEATLRTWASRRMIPCIRGRRGKRFLRFDREELDSFMRQYHQKAINPPSPIPEKYVSPPFSSDKIRLTG